MEGLDSEQPAHKESSPSTHHSISLITTTTTTTTTSMHPQALILSPAPNALEANLPPGSASCRGGSVVFAAICTHRCSLNQTQHADPDSNLLRLSGSHLFV
ncbi:hypothetical protein EYF80_019567 [Liparis tanakae]|uniref:Uncharacterized protein n=1 Tax=Liparis tanakae TaxID=230148 RepID=A0A4Z2HWG6_9TELE|nr:hypothetical protein EYF80_019567 [Liparis tanakae]